MNVDVKSSGGQLRSNKTCSWSWADKAVLRRIREAFDASHNAASALGTYLALCEIASDKGADEFQTTEAWIAHISGLSLRTASDRLKELRELELIEIHTPRLRAPSTYRLIHYPDKQPLPNDVRQQTKQGSLPTSEEQERNTEEQEKKEVFQIFPKELDTPEFKAAWGDWQEYRLGLKSKPKNPAQMFSEQLDFLSQRPNDAIEILRSSIRNGWQGIFPLKHETNRNANKPSPRNAGIASNPSDIGQLIAAKVKRG